MRRLLLFVVLLSGLGGCGDSPERGAEAIAEDARAALEDRGTLRFAMRGSGGGEPMRCDGAVDYERRRVQMSCDLGEEDFELITIGRDEYARGLWVASDESDDPKRWQKTSGGEDTARTFPDLREVLRDLRRAAISSERLGRERVRGVETTRYRVVVDPAKSELAVDEAKGKTATLELWIDDDDLLRRLRGNDDGLYDAEFFAFGEPVDIEPPPASEVADGRDLAAPGLCAGGETKPLGQAQVVGALEAHGIRLALDEAGCVWPGEGAVVALSSMGADADAPERGFALCHLQRTASGDEVRESRGADTFQLELANLSCILFWGTDEPPKGRLEDLRKAFADLRRSL